MGTQVESLRTIQKAESGIRFKKAHKPNMLYMVMGKIRYRAGLGNASTKSTLCRVCSGLHLREQERSGKRLNFFLVLSEVKVQ